MYGSAIAIGGGFLMEDLRGLQERHLLSLPRPRGERTKVLHLGTAGGDGECTQRRFMKLFPALGGEPSTLTFFPCVMLQFARDGRCVEAVTSRPGQVAVQRVHPGDEPKPLPTVPLAAAQRAAA